MAQLVQTMAATLAATDALPCLTEVIGAKLRAEACLLLRYHRASSNLIYTFWQTGTRAQAWMLTANSGSAQTELICRMAQRLIHSGTDQANAAEGWSWQEAVTVLLRDSHPPLDGLQQMQSCSAIPVTAATDIEGVVLLLHAPGSAPLALGKAEQMEIADLVAIAFHQQYLHHQAQRSHEQLTYLNYLKEDFLSTLNHELRTPLTSMMLAIRMLRRPDLTPERAALYLNILEQQCAREIHLVNDLLMLQSVDAKQPKTTLVPTDLGPHLQELVQRQQPQFARASLRLCLEVPHKPVIMATSGEYLTRVLQELLTNARKYSHPGSTVTLALVDQLAANQRVKLCLTNMGVGIQPTEMPYIFDKFHRGQNATKNAVPGTGTGLALVKGLVKQLGGTIAVASQPYTQHLWQTCFTIELPTGKETTKCG
jgi:signal transduction histidine kinase